MHVPPHGLGVRGSASQGVQRGTLHVGALGVAAARRGGREPGRTGTAWRCGAQGRPTARPAAADGREAGKADASLRLRPRLAAPSGSLLPSHCLSVSKPLALCHFIWSRSQTRIENSILETSREQEFLSSGAFALSAGGEAHVGEDRPGPHGGLPPHETRSPREDAPPGSVSAACVCVCAHVCTCRRKGLERVRKVGVSIRSPTPGFRAHRLFELRFPRCRST